MADLFLEPKVLNYQGDKYELILDTLRWARALKAKGSPEPMQTLVETALRDIVDKKVSHEEIMANKVVVAPVEEVPSVVSVAGEGIDPEAKAARAAILAEEAEEESKGKKKKKKKDD